MRFTKSMVLISVLVLTLSGCQKTEKYMEQGIALLQEEKYQEAAVAFESALKERTKYTATEEEDILLYCGEAYTCAGDFENAVETYEELISKGFHSMEVYRYLGSAQYDAGKYEDSKNSFLKAAAMGDVSAYGEAGKAAMALKSYEEAEEYFQVMMEEQPENPKWQLLMGQCVLDQQKYQEALEMFEQGIALEQGSVSEQEEKQEQRVSQIHQALLYHQAICYEYLGDFETSRNLFAIYVQQYPEDEDAQKEYEFLLSR